MRFARYLIVTVFACASVALICGAAFSTRTEDPASSPTPTKISIDYPLEGSVFPPEDSLAHCVLATALSANDQERDALAEYRKAVELTPTNPTFLDHLAVSLALNGDSNGAIDQLRKAIEVDPRSVEYRFNLGFVFESSGDLASAIPQFERAVGLSQNKDWRCLAELAKVYDKTGRSIDAVQSARQALDLALKQDDQQVAKSLQDMLNRYEHNARVH